jgi:hypothetical protein
VSQPDDYFAEVQQRLIDDPHVVTYRFLRQRIAEDSLFFRVRVTFTDESVLQVSEYCETDEGQNLAVVTYSYHWMDSGNVMRRRWDNAPHYPQLPNFPDHVHVSSEDEIPIPGEPMTLFQVLDRIAAELGA